jgi:hypothetical protein
MKTFSKLAVLVSLSVSMAAANAELISFSYIFDANSRGDSGLQLSGVVDGDIQGDGDTININSFISASLGSSIYNFGASTGMRAAIWGDTPTMSFSGATLDFWVCPAGFTSDGANAPTGTLADCPFGEGGGGFLLGDMSWTAGTDLDAWAGHPDFGAHYRVGDVPLNVSNWVSSVPVPAAAWLFGTALIGLAGVKRRHR